MNRGGWNSRRGRGRESWQTVTTESSPHQTPVRDDGSSRGCMPSNSDRKSHSSRQPAGRDLGGSAPQNYKYVTPAVCQGQGQGQGWSKFGSGSNSHEGRARQWSTSSKASSTSDCSLDNKSGSISARLHFGNEGVQQPSSEYVEAMSEGANKCSAVNLDRSFMGSVDHVLDGSQLMECEPKILESSDDVRDNENVQCSIPAFDICRPKPSSVVILKPSLLSKNREKRNEMKRSMDGPKGLILRSGMVLWKSYLSSSEQVDIINVCRTHGVGPAGFYQPCFSEGGKMHLKLMCFGKFWDPETNKYGPIRPIDGAKPPSVPHEFLRLVDRAIKDSQSLIAEKAGVKKAENILPAVKPDICIVNYYTQSGHLGLHQDKDESRESLAKGIPIVSFSIGDSAEFLYSDERDVEKAKKVILESGDVLIFGGESRHIFHGVSSIKPNTAPKSLLEETNFHPGRLNLTFRQHF